MMIVAALVGCDSLAPRGKDRPRYRLPHEAAVRIADLERSLTDPSGDTNVAFYAAVDLLRTRRAEGLEAVRAVALSPAVPVARREAVIRACGHEGDGRVVHVLVTLITDPDARIREAAVQALGRLDGATAGPALESVLVDPDSPLAARLGAARALAGLAPVFGIPALIRALGLTGEPGRAAAVRLREATGQSLGTRAEWEAWWEQNRGLGRDDWLREQAVALRRALDQEREARLALARRFVESTGSPDVRLQELLALLADPYGPARIYGAREIASLVSDRTEAAVALRRALASEEDPDVLLVLMETLEEADGEHAAEDFIGPMSSPDRRVRLAAARALGRARGPVAMDRLAARLAGEMDRGVALEIVKALGAGDAGGEAVAEALVGVLEAEQVVAGADPGLATAVAVACAGVKPTSRHRARVVVALRGYLRDAYPDPLRCCAARALGRLGAGEALGDLLDIAGASDGRVTLGLREAATLALGDLIPSLDPPDRLRAAEAQRRAAERVGQGRPPDGR